MSDDIHADNVVIHTGLVSSCLIFISSFILFFISNLIFDRLLYLSFPEASKVDIGLSLSISPVSIKFIGAEMTSACCYGISRTAENRILCAVLGGVQIRSTDLTLEKKINIPGIVCSAQLKLEVNLSLTSVTVITRSTLPT